MRSTAIQQRRETYESREVGRQGMSKRKSSDECRGDGASKRSTVLQAKQHLYLLLDDWERGYSIHKLDVDAFDADADSDLLPEQFTEPPVVRVEAQHKFSCCFISHGTKILAMQPGEGKPAIPAFDTQTLGLTICPWPSCGGDYFSPFFASVAGKIFMFSNVLAEYLGDPPPYDSKEPWSWTTIKARPPFYISQVICHALHPDGRTLFVSAGYRERSRSREPCSEHDGQGTFSFDAERLEWTRHGDWLLPFTGEAYFDAELEGWVGLCGERNCDGQLCSCDVPAEFTKAPRWNLSREKLYRKGPQMYLAAKLVYMGDSKFCLVESLLHKEDEHLIPDDSDAHCPWPRRRVLGLTKFGLKYSKKGELQITLRPSRKCVMYERDNDIGVIKKSFEPLAFWL